MKKNILLIILVSILGLSVFAGAKPDKQPLKEILNCSFTEPFINIFWDANIKVVTMNSYETGPEDVVIAKDVTVEANYSKMVIKNTEGKVLLVVKYKLGDDGMSDREFPMSAEYSISSSRVLYGGCSSIKYPAWDGYSMRKGFLPEGVVID